jgi:hypothetical protein
MPEQLVEWNAADEFILAGLAAGMTHAETAEFALTSTKPAAALEEMWRVDPVRGPTRPQ